MLKEMLQEFREFAMKGSVIDLAVGVIIGAAFAPVITTLVDNVIMPPIGILLAGIDFSALKIPLQSDPDVAVGYGLFLNAIIKFLITAFVIFLVIKAVNRFRKPAPAAAPPPPSQSEIYLKEIRDALAARS